MFEKVETGITASRAPLSGTVKAGQIVRSVHIAKNPETANSSPGTSNVRRGRSSPTSDRRWKRPEARLPLSRRYRPI